MNFHLDNEANASGTYKVTVVELDPLQLQFAIGERCAGGYNFVSEDGHVATLYDHSESADWCSHEPHTFTVGARSAIVAVELVEYVKQMIQEFYA